MDNPTEVTWHQVNITFADWSGAEQAALSHLVPFLCTAEDEGELALWWVIRKRPCWRVRYLLSSVGSHARIGRELDALTTAGHIVGWTPAIYEPEVHAFGGHAAMEVAHRFFHRDSRALLTHLQDAAEAARDHRREMSLMLCSVLMRSAGLDPYEQGDVWARVADHREVPSTVAQNSVDRLRPAAHRMITVDAEGQMSQDGPLASAAQWASAYSDAGQELARLVASGALHRGLRDVLAHHVIFAWNRLGLPYATQAILAAAAKLAVFGPDPTKSTSAQRAGS